MVKRGVNAVRDVRPQVTIKILISSLKFSLLLTRTRLRNAYWEMDHRFLGSNISMTD